jgi:hypothetical protein
MPLFSEYVPEHHRTRFGFEVVDLQLLRPFDHFPSAMKTGTPRALKFSASVCSVTVFPVPVAPAIKP